MPKSLSITKDGERNKKKSNMYEFIAKMPKWEACGAVTICAKMSNIRLCFGCYEKWCEDNIEERKCPNPGEIEVQQTNTDSTKIINTENFD